MDGIARLHCVKQRLVLCTEYTLETRTLSVGVPFRLPDVCSLPRRHVVQEKRGLDQCGVPPTALPEALEALVPREITRGSRHLCPSPLIISHQEGGAKLSSLEAQHSLFASKGALQDGGGERRASARYRVQVHFNSTAGPTTLAWDPPPRESKETWNRSCRLNPEIRGGGCVLWADGPCNLVNSLHLADEYAVKLRFSQR